MKKVIPFKKNIEFKTNISEVVSISLEHSLHKKESLITGDLIVSGEYRMTDSSVNVDKFEYTLPFDIDIDSKYDISDVEIDIDDFYYEVVNNKSLLVNIDIELDNIKENLLVENSGEDILENNFNNEEEETMNNNIEEVKDSEVINSDDLKRCVEEEVTFADKKSDESIKSLFEEVNNTEVYSTYKVYIVREGDTIDSIMTKYNINKETLETYNNLTEMKIGDKLIIPSIFNEKI